jgi:hypothetical protein
VRLAGARPWRRSRCRKWAWSRCAISVAASVSGRKPGGPWRTSRNGRLALETASCPRYPCACLCPRLKQRSLMLRSVGTPKSFLTVGCVCLLLCGLALAQESEEAPVQPRTPRAYDQALLRFNTNIHSPFAIATSLKLNFGTIAWGGVEKTCLPMKSDRYPRSLYGYGQER